MGIGPDTPGYFADFSPVEPGSGSFYGAYRAGYHARLDGKPRTANPYPDYRTARGSITFSRACRRSWWRGWDHAEKSERG